MKAAIALLTDYRIQNFVRKIVFNLNRKYNIDFFASLLPAHISLKQPFYFESIEKLENYFDLLAGSIKPFKIELDKIYYTEWKEYGILGINVKETKTLRNLHNRINRELSELFENTSAPHDGDNYNFHLTIELGKIEGENVYKNYFDKLEEKKVNLCYTVKDIALFYYPDRSLRIASFMNYKVLPLGIE